MGGKKNKGGDSYFTFKPLENENNFLTVFFNGVLVARETGTDFVTSWVLYTNYCVLDLNPDYILLGGDRSWSSGLFR